MSTPISSSINGVQAQYSIDIPEYCPVCGIAIEPKILTVHGIARPIGKVTQPAQLDVLMLCPRVACQCACLAVYTRNFHEQNIGSSAAWTLKECVPRVFRAMKFDERIEKFSPQFPRIFNQAMHAESIGLDHICGPGYRKSLEFLIKDYLCSELIDENERLKIKYKSLGACISEDVDDPRIKSMAERATWLGNDETHYLRRWETKDVSDLKKLIELTVHWIEAELITGELEHSMPKPEKGK